MQTNAQPHGRLRGKLQEHPFIQVGERVSFLHTQGLHRRLRPEAVAVPQLALQVFGLTKQSTVAVGPEHQPSPGLRKTGQVMKVAVESVGVVYIAVAQLLGGSRNQCNASTAGLHVLRQCGTAA